MTTDADSVGASEVPPAYAPASQPSAPHSARLGLVAMLLGIGVFVLSLIVSVLMGIAAAPYAVSGPNGFSVMLSAASDDPVEVRLTLASFLHVGLGTLIGVWAIVQGIIAIATRRGRGFGVVAVIFAFLAPGLSLAVYMLTALSLAG